MPGNSLPRWTRAGCLGKPVLPRRLPANRPQQRPPAAPPTDAEQAAERCSLSAEHPHVESLRRNLQFLQRQHEDTLEKLHAEIDSLRRENKELKYRLIMEYPNKKGRKHNLRDIRTPNQGSEAHAALCLQEPLQDTQPLKKQAFSLGEGSEARGLAQQDRGMNMKRHLITYLHPLKIHGLSSRPPPAPTLHECGVVIQQLYDTNSLQSQELISVKALLREIVLSKKITPENHILAKSYLTDGACKSKDKKLPTLGLQSFPENSSGTVQSRLVLPTLKESLSTSIAERQRTTRCRRSIAKDFVFTD